MGLPKPLADRASGLDRAEGEWARRAVDEWARTMEFPRPFRWGDAEAAVLARDYPPLPGSLVWSVLGAIGWAAVALLAVPLLGASPIGLVLVATGAAQGGADAAFAIATVTAAVFLGQWRETRRRSAFALGVNGITALTSAAAFAVAAVSGSPTGPWLPVLTLASAALAAVSLVLGLASKPEGRAKRRKPPRRGPRGSGKRARAMRARRRMLEILVHRGLVDLDEGDRIRVGEMPLGYWSELDGLDEREWRRVLERRHVGWRDFDAT